MQKKLNELRSSEDTAPAMAKAKTKGKAKGGGEQVDPNAPLAMAALEGEVSDLALRVRGEPDLKGEVVPRAFPVALKHPSTPALTSEGSGRLELAEWLASPDHPLTARVMANRVWGHLFGRGLVGTVDNFGLSGEAPTHPELLDHLATRFVSNGWSVKSLIREIVLSRAYRLSTTHDAGNQSIDEAIACTGGRTCGDSKPKRSAIRSSPPVACCKRNVPGERPWMQATVPNGKAKGKKSASTPPIPSPVPFAASTCP